MSNRQPKMQVERMLRPFVWGLSFFALLAIAALLYWQENYHERLFHVYFIKEPITIVENTRVLAGIEGGSGQFSLLYQQAIAYQNAEDYPAALMTWRAYFREESPVGTPLPYWYAAIVAHQLGAVEEAAYFLDQIPSNLPISRNEQLQWHRALTALRQKNTLLTRQLLEEMQHEAKTIYGKELATELLAEIKEVR